MHKIVTTIFLDLSFILLLAVLVVVTRASVLDFIQMPESVIRAGAFGMDSSEPGTSMAFELVFRESEGIGYGYSGLVYDIGEFCNMVRNEFMGFPRPFVGVVEKVDSGIQYRTALGAIQALKEHQAFDKIVICRERGEPRQ